MGAMYPLSRDHGQASHGTSVLSYTSGHSQGPGQLCLAWPGTLSMPLPSSPASYPPNPAPSKAFDQC